MKQVRAFLDAEEVEYEKAKRLGSGALPFLDELSRGGDLALATKAIYLASLLSGKKAVEILEIAAASPEPLLRVAAASGIRNLSESRSKKVLYTLLKDEDPGIRKVAIRSSSHLKSAKLEKTLTQLSKNDPELFLRELATANLQVLRKRK